MQIGSYQVLGELARGGFGVVYRARDPRGEEVALKLLLAQGDPEETERFLREGQVLARLSHPNVVRIRDAGQERGRPFLVLDLVEGPSLAARLAEGGPLSEVEAVALLSEIAAATQAAHAAGILHRDLKPANVLIQRGRPLLTDFGIARVAHARSLTQTGELLGTPGYMAPEQIEGDKARLGPATDVYGLGAILYACLTGQPPFRGATVLATIDQALRGSPQPPSALRPELNRRLETICMRCLAREPAERYASAADLIDALEAWSPVEPSPGPRPARLAGLLLVVGVLVLLGAGVWGGARLWAPSAAPSLLPSAPSSPPLATGSLVPPSPAAAADPEAAARARRLLARGREEASRDLALAQRSLESAIEADPALHAARVELALVHVVRYELELGERLLASVDLSLMESGPERARLHFARGRLRLAQGRRSEALRALAEAEEQDPERAEYLAWRGMAGDLLDSALLKRAIWLGAEDPAVVLFKLACQAERGYSPKIVESALDEVERTLRRAPASPELAFARAQLLFEGGQSAAAESAIRALGDEWPKHPEPRRLLGWMCTQLVSRREATDPGARLRQAERLFAEALALAPGDPGVRRELAWLPRVGGDFAESLARHEQLITDLNVGWAYANAFVVVADWLQHANRTRDLRGLENVDRVSARAEAYLGELEQRFPLYLARLSFGADPAALADARARLALWTARVYAAQRRWDEADRLLAREAGGQRLGWVARQYRVAVREERLRHRLQPDPALVAAQRAELEALAQSASAVSVADAVWLSALRGIPLPKGRQASARPGDEVPALKLELGAAILARPRQLEAELAAWRRLCAREGHELLPWLGRAEALLAADRLEEVERMCLEVPGSLPSDPLLLTARARALSLHGAREAAERQSRWTAAEALFGQALERAPECEPARAAWVEHLIRSGARGRAAAELTKLRGLWSLRGEAEPDWIAAQERLLEGLSAEDAR